ncbi:MAG TPA: IPT/TIG domain-containing protein [Bacteroidales bacterium]
MKTKLIYITFLLVLTFYSCKKDADPEPTDYPFVLLSEVNDITSDGATFNANITNLGNQKILDYGFVWDDSISKPTINSKIESLGNNPSLEKFSYRVNNDLEKGKHFNVRAYIKTDKVIVYSNIRSFISKGCLPPVINKFYPDSGSAGRIITIIGNNFSSKSSSIKIYFGAIHANVIKCNSDTILVQCPNTLQTIITNIILEVASQQSLSQSKFKLIYPWTQLQNFPGGASDYSSSFTIGSKGYVCLGTGSFNNLSPKTLWEYDKITDNWNPRIEFPGHQRYNAIGFSMLGKGYVGLGYDNSYLLYKDLYEYDPAVDLWIKKADFPGNLSYFKPISFVINNKLFLYSSQIGCELWMYDPLKDQWSLQPSLEINGKWFYISYAYNGFGYLLEDELSSNTTNTQLWEFNPLEYTVKKVATLAFQYIYWTGDCFVLHDFAYLPHNYGSYFQYNLVMKSCLNLSAPTSDFYSNFIFQFDDKIVVNKSKSNLVYEFCPK